MEKIKRGNLRADELDKQKKQKRKKVSLTIVIVFIVVGVLLMGLIFFNSKLRSYNGYEIVHTTELSNTTGSTYLSYKTGVLKLSRDGVEAMNAEGKVLWNVGYNMKDPIGVVCGNYSAIADRGGTTFITINGHGDTNTINTKFPIEQIEVASQGVTAVLTSNGEDNYIEIYSFDSQTKLLDMNTNTDKHGFPVDIALSMDGKKLITSYIAIEGDTIKSWVTFYNFSEYGKNLTDSTAGTVSFENIIPEIKFLTNDLICIYKDNGFILYKMKELPEAVAIEDINEEIESTFSNSSMIGFIVRGAESDGSKKLILYNYSGKKELEQKIQVSYEKVTMTDDLIIFYSPLTSDFYNLRGKHLFTSTFSKNVNYIFPTDKSNYLLYVSDAAMERIQLKGTKEE